MNRVHMRGLERRGDELQARFGQSVTAFLCVVRRCMMMRWWCVCVVGCGDGPWR